MNRFELWHKVARCRLQQHFRLVVALWLNGTLNSAHSLNHSKHFPWETFKEAILMCVGLDNGLSKQKESRGFQLCMNITKLACRVEVFLAYNDNYNSAGND